MPPSAQASEIQSKLVAAIRQIAELEEKIEQCEKKSKELAADVERRSRQTFYLERNLDSRETEIAEINKQIYTLNAKADASDFESVRDDQELSLGRLQRKTDTLKDDLKKAEAKEKAAKEAAKKSAQALSKKASSSSEIVTMFMEEYEKHAKESAQLKFDISREQSGLVDETGVFDMQKKHVRYLEQYRTDSIFRLMGLKAHVKVLSESLESKAGIDKLASSIGV